MIRLRVITAAVMGCALGSAFIPSTAAGQLREGTVVTCESGGRLVRCPAALSWRGARLVKQLSRTACLQGKSWGFERNAIWVDDGCRGEFEAGDPFANFGERVVCASAGGTRVECPADTRFGVRLVQRISAASCVEGRTWGTGPGAIWVDRGCRGEFEIGGPKPGDAGTPSTRRFACGKTEGQQVSCRTEGYATSVRLLQDLSGGRCREGYSWGFTDSFIWANRGCRALFEVSYRDSAAGGGNLTRRISCGAADYLETSCRVDGPITSVRLVNDQSGGRCRDRRSWGYNSSFLWTTRGCRGEFEVTYRGSGSGQGMAETRTISCGTSSGRQVTCATNGYATAVRLIRDRSNGICREGGNWGHTDSFIWANRGCRGDFEVTYRSSETRAVGTRVITCGTGTARQVTCEAGGLVLAVRLVRDLSDGRCRQGTTWGHTDTFVWTARGCRGEFRVTYQDRMPRR